MRVWEDIVLTTPWRDWYHCMVGTYGQWLPGDPRGWRERNHHEHVPGDYKHPPPVTAFSKGRYEHSKRIMNWHAYSIAAADREIVGRLLLRSFQHQGIPTLVLAVCETNFHAMLQVSDHNPKRVLGAAKCFATLNFSPIIDPSTNKRQQIWEGGARAKPIKNRAHAVKAFEYIRKHVREGAWVWSYRDDPDYARTLARAVRDGGRGGQI
jgi:hypothetical protein